MQFISVDRPTTSPFLVFGAEKAVTDTVHKLPSQVNALNVPADEQAK